MMHDFRFERGLDREESRQVYFTPLLLRRAPHGGLPKLAWFEGSLMGLMGLHARGNLWKSACVFTGQLLHVVRKKQGRCAVLAFIALWNLVERCTLEALPESSPSWTRWGSYCVSNGFTGHSFRRKPSHSYLRLEMNRDGREGFLASLASSVRALE